MSQQDNFDRIITALHDAAFDDTVWPRASALIDEAVGMLGSHLLILSGQTRADLVLEYEAAYYRGEPFSSADYLQHYFPTDERIPRFLRLPDSRVVSMPELFTAQERQTSPTYNELLPRSHGQRGLNVRMDGLDGLHIAWVQANSTDPLGWGSAQLTLSQRLLPHIRQFVRVRQALVKADALRASLAHLLDNTLIGILALDRRGTIVETNARALRLLQRGDGVRDRAGILHARFPSDDAPLQRLIANALPH